MELTVDLGPMPPDPLSGGAIAGGGLCRLLDRKEFCDVMIVAGGQSFVAHSLVLAAVSPTFHQQILQASRRFQFTDTDGSVVILTKTGSDIEAQVPGHGDMGKWRSFDAATREYALGGGSGTVPQESVANLMTFLRPQDNFSGRCGTPVTLYLNEIVHSEAVQDMLSCIYGPFGVDSRENFCKTELANRDALQLAHAYQIPQLQAQVSRWLIQNLTSQNVLGRLVLCEEFGLLEAREKILEQLIADPAALPILASHPEVTKVPKVLQDLLVRILGLLGQEVHAKPQAVMKPGKLSRKAGA